MLKNTLFRYRIFIAMILVNLIVITIMALINYYQNSKNFTDRKEKELIQLDQFIKEGIIYQLDKDSFKNRDKIIQGKIYEYFDTYNSNISIYDINGKLIASNLKRNMRIQNSVLQNLKQNKKDLLIKDTLIQNKKYTWYNSYSIVRYQQKPFAVLNIEKFEERNSAIAQTIVLIKQYVFLIIFMFILSGLIAWQISKTLTKRINRISRRIQEANLYEWEGELRYSENDEIKPLVNAYNQMQSTLKEQTQLLKKNERAEAWKEMARQVAHEINNPLTPLKLTVQNFERRYKNDDPQNDEKVKNLTKVVVHQIDLISSITAAFSDFAKMPVNEVEEINVVEIIERTISIFPSQIVSFDSNVEELKYKMDRLYLTRIITNIVKNSMQAIPDTIEKKIRVSLKNEKHRFQISITDNGTGISEENKDKVFQPNFTTKSDGMGLGLSMVKKIVEDYGGKIWFETQQNFGTVFFLEFTKETYEN